MYHGWALTTPTSYPSPFGSDWHNQCITDHGYRGYADEILRMEQSIFKWKNQHVRVHDGHGKMQKFGTWYLTTDTSLVGASPDELASIIGEDMARTGEWDSAPLELVSRVLDVDAASSYTEIDEMFQTLDAGRSGRTEYQAFTDPCCGLHVHIGLPPPPSSSTASSNSSDQENGTFPLTVLQHLAYITIVYESILSLLHPPHRRPEHPKAQIDLRSNKEGFYAEPDYSAIDWEAVPDADSGKDRRESTSAQRMAQWSNNKYNKLANLKRKRAVHDDDDDEAYHSHSSTSSSTSSTISDTSTNDPNSAPNLRHRAHHVIFPATHPMTLAEL
ncbi:MAG: hypothetical protein Q9168_006344, partial [Polycauliona sp. 1 TL-2023]